jgi:hypothetical protein
MNVLVSTLLARLVRFGIIVAAHDMILPSLEVMKPKCTNVDRSCHAIPLKNGICPYKDIRRIQGPAQNELEKGPRDWVRLLLI